MTASSPKRSFLNRSQKIWTFAVTGATLIGIVVTALTLLNTRESSVETVSARNSQGAVAATQDEDFRVIGELEDPLAIYHDNSDSFLHFWQIPISAPLETFPGDLESRDGYMSCGEKQYTWLEEHARENKWDGWGKFTLTLQNDATSGGSVTLTNIRFEGEEVASEAVVAFVCPVAGMGSRTEQQILINTSGESAKWGPEKDTEGARPEGSPVSLFLAPGEALPLELVRAPEVDTQREYAGRFVAEIVSEAEETVVIASNALFHREVVPGYKIAYDMDGNLECSIPLTGPRFEGDKVWQDTSDTTPCTLSEAADLLKQAKEASAS